MHVHWQNLLPWHYHQATNDPISVGTAMRRAQSHTEKKPTYERLGSWHAWCDLYSATCDLRCRLRVTLQNWSCGAVISASFGAMTRETPLSILVCDR